MTSNWIDDLETTEIQYLLVSVKNKEKELKLIEERKMIEDADIALVEDLFNKKISIKDLLYLKNLKYLNLENNSISILDKGSFDSLVNLEYLSLALNRISNLDNADLFRNLLNLKELNLSSNFIEILNENFLRNLNKLVTLDLSSNRIFMIKNYSFNSLANF